MQLGKLLKNALTDNGNKLQRKMKSSKDCRMFNYRKTLLPNKYLALLEKGVQDIEEAKTKTGFSIGYPGWNFLYYTVLCSLDRTGDNIIVETGTNWGCSTIILAQALRDSGLKGHVFSVEIDLKNFKRAKLNLNKAKLSRYVTLIRDDSIKYLKKFTKDMDRITFAFLDGCHLESHVLKEFDIVYPKLGDNSVVFLDNTSKQKCTGRGQRVYGATKKILKKYGGNIVNFENVSWSTPGMAIWQKNGFRKELG